MKGGAGSQPSDGTFPRHRRTPIAVAWEQSPSRGRNPKERDGILAKLKKKGKLTTTELATYGITEKPPTEPEANGDQEEPREKGAVVSETTRLFSESQAADAKPQEDIAHR
jgi:hypothetical protein